MPRFATQALGIYAIRTNFAQFCINKLSYHLVEWVDMVFPPITVVVCLNPMCYGCVIILVVTLNLSFDSAVHCIWFKETPKSLASGRN